VGSELFPLVRGAATLGPIPYRVVAGQVSVGPRAVANKQVDSLAQTTETDTMGDCPPMEGDAVVLAAHETAPVCVVWDLVWCGVV
jgi:hypothetical protein